MPPPATGSVRTFIALALAAGLSPASAVGAEPPEPNTLKVHTGWVGGVAFSPDGKTLATASADHTVKLTDLATGKHVATLKTHMESAVVAVAFSPDGKRVASAGYDHRGRVWDAATGRELVHFHGHKGAVLAVAFSPDGKTVATGSIDGKICLWDAANENAPHVVMPGHKSWVNAVAFSPDGKTLASGSSDNTVVLWDTATKRPRQTFRPKAAEIRSVAWSPDGKSLAAGTRYGITKVWNAATGEEVASLKGKGGDVWAVAFAPDGKTLAAADGDWNTPSDVVLWDATTRKERGRVKHTNEVLCLAFHPTKPVLAAGARDKAVKVWDLTDLLKADQ